MACLPAGQHRHRSSTTGKVRRLPSQPHTQLLGIAHLWAYEDVSGNAAAILERVRNATMPCDGAWPLEKVETFERWTTAGMSK